MYHILGKRNSTVRDWRLAFIIKSYCYDCRTLLVKLFLRGEGEDPRNGATASLSEVPSCCCLIYTCCRTHLKFIYIFCLSPSKLSQRGDVWVTDLLNKRNERRGWCGKLLSITSMSNHTPPFRSLLLSSSVLYATQVFTQQLSVIFLRARPPLHYHFKS